MAAAANSTILSPYHNSLTKKLFDYLLAGTLILASLPMWIIVS
jgi:hypothetical protein